jgi:hypothetical protein
LSTSIFWLTSTARMRQARATPQTCDLFSGGLSVALENEYLTAGVAEPGIPGLHTGEDVKEYETMLTRKRRSPAGHEAGLVARCIRPWLLRWFYSAESPEECL